MALSNWDTFALDINGDPIGGLVQNDRGVGVEIYKNWIYVHDPRATKTFEEGRLSLGSEAHFGFGGDVVMQLDYGHFTYANWDITARRGPKDGIYVVAWHQRWEGSHVDQQLLVGCGVYGWETSEHIYRDYLASLGVDYTEIWASNHWDDNRWVNQLVLLDEHQKPVVNPNDGTTVFEPPDPREPEFIGIEEADVEFLRDLALEVAGPPAFRYEDHERVGEEIVSFPGTTIRSLDFSKGLRVNQGDLLFFDEEGTPAGEADEPTFTKFLRDNQ